MNAFTLGGDERADLVSRLEAGDFAPLSAFLAKTRQAEDWDDRAFMLELVAGAAETRAVRALVDGSPKDANLRLFSGIHHFDKAWEARGTGTADTITREGAAAMDQLIATAQAELQAAATLDTADPTPLAFLIGVAQLGANVDAQSAFTGAVQRDPGNLGAYWRGVGITTEKWGGSLDTCLGLARRAARARPGSDLTAVLFRAHMEAWFHRKWFQNDAAAAHAYAANPAVKKELEAALDGWLTPAYQPRRCSIPGLHWAAAWFFLAGDAARTKCAMRLTNNVQPDQMLPYTWISELAYTQALQASLGA